MHKHKILVADDSSVEADSIRHALRALVGAEVTVVDDGAQAVREAKNQAYDLVLCDYEMPGLNGLQVVRVLRANWSRLELPILMLTVRDDVQTKVASLRQGANDYVTKPVQPEELLARVQAHLDLKVAVEDNIKARVQIVNARKVEAVGRLACGLAHQLNTPAQFTADNLVFLQKVVTNAAELLLRTRDRASEAGAFEAVWAGEFATSWTEKHMSYLLAEGPKALEESLRGVMQMSHIVRELKEFTGVADKGWGLADINRALENTVAVSRHLWSGSAEIALHLDRTLPQVACDITALRQAFFNILSFAVEEAERLGVPGLAVTIVSQRTPDGIEIRFSDDGPAVPEGSPWRKLGERDGARSGFSHGLLVAESVVTGQHRGRLECSAGSERGKTFVIRLNEGLSKPAPLVRALAEP